MVQTERETGALRGQFARQVTVQASAAAQAESARAQAEQLSRKLAAARAEVRRFADEDTSERVRNEMMGVLGELLGISPEQMEELRSEDGQRRLHEGMKKFEGEVQDAIDKMMGGQGGSQGGPQGTPMPHPPVDPRQFPFFSQN